MGFSSVPEAVADTGTTASAGGPDKFGPGPLHPTTDESDMPTNAGGTGAIAGRLRDFKLEQSRRRTLFRQNRQQIPSRGTFHAGD